MLLLGAAAYASAQQQSSATRLSVKTEQPFLVKTVPLHHLRSQDAVKLLSPYVQTLGGGVYEASASSSIRAVTIRETQTVFNEMMAVLERYDRDPANVVLNFQLIAAENTNTREIGRASCRERGQIEEDGVPVQK